MTNPDGQAGTLNGAFTYRAAPTVTSVSPTSGPTGGGTTITVTGTAFVSGATVRVNGVAATGVTFVSATLLRANTPAAAAGTYAVQVTNPDGQADTLNGAFTYVVGPSLTSVSPASGPSAGDTTITINGSSFVSGATVRVNGVAATGVTFVSATQLRANTPAAAAGTYAVQVTNPDGQADTLNGAFTYVGGPGMTSVSPASGPTAGGTTITITGTGFVSGATVRVNGVTATGVTFVSATQLRANTPAAAAGTYAVRVTNPDGQAGTLNGAFTYRAAPTVTSVSPTSGPTGGGTTITVTGTAFVSGATVRVNGVAATGVTFVSATLLRANTPAAAAGTYAVQVTNPDGQADTLNGAFTYVVGPSLTSVSPASGPSAGDTTITINGSSFVSGATVRVNGVAATGVTFVSATQLRANTPAAAAGTYAVQVTNPDGQADTLNGAFTYVGGPGMTSVSPASGPTAGGTTITITGTGFVSGATVRVNGVTATGVTFVSATQLRANTPAAAAGTYAVRVTNPDGQAGTLNGAFTYRAAPTVTSVSPTSGPTGGGTSITVTGTAFVSGATVAVNGVAATGVTFLSATQVRAVTPAGTAGARSVQVTNPDGQADTLANAFTYTTSTPTPTPTLTAVSPASGPTTGGTTVTITGTNFAAGATVTVGGAAATSVVVASATSITARTPAGAAGARDVRVTLSGGQAATRTGGFTYTAPTTPSPTLTGVSPVSGPAAGGTAVTLSGTNFAAGATVTVGGAAATSVVVVSSTRITARTPAGTAGARDVRVTLSGGQAATLAGGFTYTAGTSTDSDGDGLTNEWETLYGLNPNSAAGVDGAAGDPDADGRTNAAEQTAGSHPRGTLKRYLAEGVSNSFFSTRFAIANPQTSAARVLLTFVDTTGRTTRHYVSVPARTRSTIDTSTIAALNGASFATTLEADAMVVLDRLMTLVGPGRLRRAHGDRRRTARDELVPRRGRDAREFRPVLPDSEPEQHRRGHPGPLPEAVGLADRQDLQRGRRQALHHLGRPGRQGPAGDRRVGGNHLDQRRADHRRALHVSQHGEQGVQGRPQQRRRDGALAELVPRRRIDRRLLLDVCAGGQSERHRGDGAGDVYPGQRRTCREDVQRGGQQPPHDRRRR